MRHLISSSPRSAVKRRPYLKPLAAIVLAGALAGALSGCSTSPPAAMVNGRVISQAQLADQLRALASSPAYIRGFDEEMASLAQQAEAQGQTNVPTITVAGTGTGSGDYGMYWTTQVLSVLVTQLAVHEYVAAHRMSPSALQLAAAWASEDAQNPTVWDQMTPGLRSKAAEADAERALVDAKLTNAATDKQFYGAHRSYFWSQVCLTSVNVSVAGKGGAVDMAASKKEATSVAGELSGRSGAPGNPVTSGARYCLSPEQLIEQPAAFRTEVGSLATGQAAAVAQSDGYQVVKVRGRTDIAYRASDAGDIEVVAVHGGSQASPTGDAKIISILKSAHVTVDPNYGAWATNISGSAPQIVPPGYTA